MTLFEAILLGGLQGLTEFLPISSSGHLVLAEALFGIRSSQMDLLGFDVLLHVGSLLALLFYYARTWWGLLWKDHYRLLLIIVGTMPGAVVGFLFSDRIGSMSHALIPTFIQLGMTGYILLRIDTWWARVRKHRAVEWKTAVMVGIAQAFALLPGLSRSGLTIAAGYLCGLSKKDAVDFSFLLAAPIIGGASLEVARLWGVGIVSLPSLPLSLSGVGVSFITSALAIHVMRWWVLRKSLAPFGVYLLLISGIGIVIALLG